MQSLRRSSHFPSVFTLIFAFPTLILPLLLAHFKLSHVGGCQTGAPQCGVSLIRTDRHQRESAACVSVPRRRRLIFIFIFPLPESPPPPRLPRERGKKSSSLLCVCELSPAALVHLFLLLPASRPADASPSIVSRSLGWAARVTPWPFSPYGMCGGTASAWTVTHPVRVILHKN